MRGGEGGGGHNMANSLKKKTRILITTSRCQGFSGCG